MYSISNKESPLFDDILINRIFEKERNACKNT